MKTTKVVELPTATLGKEAGRRRKRYTDEAYATLRNSHFGSRAEYEAAIYDVRGEGIRILRRSAIQINARKRLGQILGIQIEGISQRFALVESGELTMEDFKEIVTKGGLFVPYIFEFAQQAVDNPANPFTYEEIVRAIIDELLQTYPYIPNPGES